MTKQITAVEWFFEKVMITHPDNLDELIKKAKEMEKEQNKGLYSEEELKKYGEFCVAKFIGAESVSLNDSIFEQFKKK